AVPKNYPYHPQGEFQWQAAREFYEPLATLAFLAAKTNRLRLGVSVLILSYRNPLLAAKELATLDALSEGRMFLGVGTGWWEDEYKALGIGEHFAQRGARTDEYLRIYKVLWTQENPEFKGKFHEFGNLEFSPKPRQPGGMPIWIGGHTPRALKRVAEFGDVWHPIGLRPPAGLDPQELGQKRQELQRLTAQAKRDPGAISIAFRCPVAFGGKRQGMMTGSALQIVEDIRAYQAVGVSHLTLDTGRPTAEESLAVMEQVASEIMPHFA
ncbi:MAG TPA: TIGR03619 family F420-dependent LLM class oxidoreductase, partial [bacterium]|nr:TIGR03619 family F420-dependent LLM class oxidoreductase [bacterium]